MFLYVFTAEILIPHHTNKLNNTLLLAFGFLCFTILGIVLFFRAKKIRPAFDVLRLKPDDPAALQQWRTGAILTAVLLEAQFTSIMGNAALVALPVLRPSALFGLCCITVFAATTTASTRFPRDRTAPIP